MNKKEYVVLLKEIYDDGMGRVVDKIISNFTTWATSEKRAISNIKFRTGINDYNCFQDLGCDSYRKKYFVASEVIKRGI